MACACTVVPADFGVCFHIVAGMKGDRLFGFSLLWHFEVTIGFDSFGVTGLVNWVKGVLGAIGIFFILKYPFLFF